MATPPVPPVPLVLLGCGGHASDVLGVVEALNDRAPTYQVIGLLGDDPDADLRRFEDRGAPLLGGLDHLRDLEACWVAAVGWPEARRRVVARALASGRSPTALVSPWADVGAGVQVGTGTVVVGGARLSPRSCLGDHVLVSYLAAVGHDSSVGTGASVMPGAMVSGEVDIGEGVLVGTNATILQGLRIGDRAAIGAGAVVTRDVAAGTTVVGNPARAQRRRPGR